ncbi:MAG: polysaccharide pyruvyl transferase family protein [Pseudomonadota bacterium]
MKILLANDTGTKAHIGCQAVSDAHARLLGRAGHRVVHRCFVNELRSFARDSLERTVRALERSDALMDRLDAADAVVVNGEGTLHHDNGIEWLALLALAQRRGKATLLVNALYQEMSVDTAVLAKLDAFFVRDPRSAAYVAGIGISCRVAPDSIVAAGFHDTPRIDFGGGLVVTDWVKKRDPDVGAALIALMMEQPADAPAGFYPLHDGTARAAWSRARADVATAKGVVTGRYHGLYLALLAGVPAVPMASNSWKVDAFLEAWRLPLRPCNDLQGARAALAGLDESRSAFRDAAARLRDAGEPPIFDVLGRGDDESNEERERAVLREDIAGRSAAIAAEARAVAKRRLREARMQCDLLSANGQARRGGALRRWLASFGR